MKSEAYNHLSNLSVWSARMIGKSGGVAAYPAVDVETSSNMHYIQRTFLISLVFVFLQ